MKTGTITANVDAGSTSSNTAPVKPPSTAPAPSLIARARCPANQLR